MALSISGFYSRTGWTQRLGDLWAVWLRLSRAAAVAVVGLSLLASLGACGSTGVSAMSTAQAMNALAAEPVDSEPWEWSRNPGLLIKTPHYRIYTTVRDPLYQRLIARVLEASYERAQRFHPAPKKTSPMECYVFGDRGQWELYTKLRAGSNAPIYLQISAGGYCQEGVFAGYDIGREQTLSVIAHEAWHQYSWYAFKDRLPSWLEEGLATQNESVEWQGVTPTFAPEQNYRRFAALKQAMRENRLWKLQDLTSTHAGKVIKLQEKHVSAYYAQLWSLVLFLEHSRYRPQLGKILDDARGGRLSDCLAGTGITKAEMVGFTERWNTVAGPTYMRHYLRGDLAKLDLEYQAFLRDFTSTWPPKLDTKAGRD